MKSRTTKAVIVVALVLCLALAGAGAALWRFVTSDRFREWVEVRAAKAIGRPVHITSLQFTWPLDINIEGLTVSSREPTEPPLIDCQRLRITTTPFRLLRKHVDSIVVVGATVNVSAKDGEGSSGQLPSVEGASGNAFNVETIKIVNSDLSLDLPNAKADITGILATYSKPYYSSGGERVLRLHIDAVQASFGAEGSGQIPVYVKVGQSQAVFRKKRSATEVEAEIHALLTTTIPHLLLPPDIPVRMAFEFDHVPKRDAIENGIFSLDIPLFNTVSLYGSVNQLTSGAPGPNLTLTMETPEIADLLEYNELFQRPSYKDMRISGKLSVNGDVKGTFQEPILSLRAVTNGAQFEWKGIALDGVNIDMPIQVKDKEISSKQGRVSAGSARVPWEGQVFEFVSMNGLVSVDMSRIQLEDCTVRPADIVDVGFDGAYEFESGQLHTRANVEKVSVGDVLGFIPADVYKLPDTVSVGGTIGFSCDAETTLPSTLDGLKVNYNISLQEGEVTSGETVAAAGIGGNVCGKLKAGSKPGRWEFEVDGGVGGFELLVEAFYKDFSKRTFPFSATGEFEPESKNFRNVAAAIDLGNIGKVNASGDLGLGETSTMDVEIKPDRINLGNLFGEIRSELMLDRLPLLTKARVGGIVNGRLGIKAKDKKWEADGIMKLAGGEFALTDDVVVMDAIKIDLPFAVGTPRTGQVTPVAFKQEDYGNINIGNLTIGPVDAGTLALDVGIKENAFRIKDFPAIRAFGGTVDIGPVEGKEILGASAKVATSVAIREVDVKKVMESFKLPTTEGQINGDFPRIALTQDVMAADGSIKTEVFGGTIDLTTVNVMKPLSPFRTFGGDVEFKEINLLKFTDTLDFGSISGVMEGTLKGLEISQGQAAAFVADFETVERKGVKQRINLDAVQNITILGTGRGFTGGVGRGLATFFDEFGYDKIGFYCTLKNDNFRMKGKVVRGDTEYFVKGVMIGPSINVINRNPNQSVSFKSMLERVNRVKARETEDAD